MQRDHARIRTGALAILKIVAFFVAVKLLTQVVVFMGLAQISARFWSQYDGRGLNEPWFLGSSIGLGGVALLVCFLFLRFIDKRDWSYVRLRSAWPLRMFGTGALIACGAVVLFTIVAVLSGAVSISPALIAGPRIAVLLIVAALGNLALVMREEVMMRGYALRTLEEGINTPIAVLVTSLLFGALHLANPNASLLGALNISLMGSLLAVLCIVYRSLWLPIGLHFGWNLALYLLNLPVSGHRHFNPLVSLEYNRHTLLTGSAFGPEDSLVVTIVLSMILAVIYVLHRRGSDEQH